MPVTQAKVVSDADRRIQQLAATLFELNAESEASEALLLAEGFSAYELAAYLPAARQLANQRFVRQDAVDEPSDERVIAIALDRCGGLIGTAAITTELRRAHITPRQIARLWDVITVKLAANVARLPHPSVEDMRGAFV